MKYIRHKEHGFLLFEEHILHNTFASWIGGPEQVISAGFVRDNGSGVLACYGESTTLQCSARGDDTKCLHARLGMVEVPEGSSPGDAVLRQVFEAQSPVTSPNK